MAADIRRREALALLIGTAAWPLGTRAQPGAVPVVGLLDSQKLELVADLVAAVRDGLKQTGYVEGENVAIEYRFADGDRDRLAGMAAELVQRPVAVIVATDNPSAVAAKGATKTIPIVFATGGEPVNVGLVTSLGRPRGNITGIGYFAGALADERLDLLREVVPGAQRIAVLVDQHGMSYAAQRKAIQDAARDFKLKLDFVTASSEGEIDAAFATLIQQQARALLVGSSAYFSWNRRQQIVAQAARARVPAIYPLREYVVGGGLMSYGVNLPDTYRQLGVYAGKILKGARPADLPVEQSSRFEFVINRKTASALGLEIAGRLLALADYVIE